MDISQICWNESFTNHPKRLVLTGQLQFCKRSTRTMMPFDAVSMCLGFHEVFMSLYSFLPPPQFFESQKNHFWGKRWWTYASAEGAWYIWAGSKICNKNLWFVWLNVEKIHRPWWRLEHKLLHNGKPCGRRLAWRCWWRFLVSIV